MRLQRAYLLDHLRKMMEHTSIVEGSEGSADEETTTVSVHSSYSRGVDIDLRSSHLSTDHTATSADAILNPHHLAHSRPRAHMLTNLHLMRLPLSRAFPLSRKLAEHP